MSGNSTDKLAAVRAKFIAGLQGRADTIEALMASEDSVEKQAELQVLVHKIAGAAGFYAEEKIAEAAGKIDVALQTLNDFKDLPKFNAKLNELVTMLRAL